MKIPIFPQNSSKICIFKILINKKKNKGQILYYFFIFLFYLTCFTTVPIFKSIGPLVAEIWKGGGGGKQPPPPMDSSPQNNPMGLGLKQQFLIPEIQKSLPWEGAHPRSVATLPRRAVNSLPR